MNVINNRNLLIRILHFINFLHCKYVHVQLFIYWKSILPVSDVICDIKVILKTSIKFEILIVLGFVSACDKLVWFTIIPSPEHNTLTDAAGILSETCVVCMFYSYKRPSLQPSVE